MTAWNLLEAVILYRFCFMIGAFPTALNRTTTIGPCVSQFGGRTYVYCVPFAPSFFLYVSRASSASWILAPESIVVHAEGIARE